MNFSYALTEWRNPLNASPPLMLIISLSVDVLFCGRNDVAETGCRAGAISRLRDGAVVQHALTRLMGHPRLCTAYWGPHSCALSPSPTWLPPASYAAHVQEYKRSHCKSSWSLHVSHYCLTHISRQTNYYVPWTPGLCPIVPVIMIFGKSPPKVCKKCWCYVAPKLVWMVPRFSILESLLKGISTAFWIRGFLFSCSSAIIFLMNLTLIA